MARSRFAGFFRAIDYAYGLGPEFPPALIIDTGNSAAGSASVTVSKGYTIALDGTVFFPLATNASVNVGSGSNLESVTPSAVSNNSLTGYAQTGFTATFSNVHGVGDFVSSATFGLQEAINAANAAGGGSVVVDSRWTALGGTTAILNAATVPVGVALYDNRGSQGTIQTVTVAIANAAVKTLFSAPTTVIPAQGAGTLVEVQSMVLTHVYLTAAFAAGGAIQLSYDTGVTNAASATIAATFLTSASANQSTKVAGALAVTANSALLNKKIILAAATADFTTGGGSLIAKIAYRTWTGLS